MCYFPRKLQLYHFYVKDCISDMKYEICDVYKAEISHSGYNVSLEFELKFYTRMYKMGYIYTRMTIWGTKQGTFTRACTMYT